MVKKKVLILAILLLCFNTLLFITQKPEKLRVNVEEFPEKEPPPKIPKRDRIDLAMKHEYDMTHDPSVGYIPKERLKQAREIKNAKLSKRQKKGATAAGLSNVTWTERGPDNVGGRTRALIWDPNDGNNTKVWAGSVSGGLWYNNDVTDANSEWQNVSDTWDNIAISALTYDPNNTNIFYLGTGEGHVIGTTRGEGMYKSTDGGSTWTHMTATNGFYATDHSTRRK